MLHISICCKACQIKYTTVLRPFFQDHPFEPVPEDNFWTLWCNGRLTEADTLIMRMGATPPRLSSAGYCEVATERPVVKKWSTLKWATGERLDNWISDSSSCSRIFLFYDNTNCSFFVRCWTENNNVVPKLDTTKHITHFAKCFMCLQSFSIHSAEFRIWVTSKIIIINKISKLQRKFFAFSRLYHGNLHK